jgi:uncharacterized protein
MWHKLAAFIIKYRVALMILLLAITGIMGYFASKVELSYEFARAVPTDNPKYIAYQEFRKQFGEDGNLMVIGVDNRRFFEAEYYNDYRNLVKDIEKVKGVQNVLSIPTAIQLLKDTVTDKLNVSPIPREQGGTPEMARDEFTNLPFYQGLLWNPKTNSYVIALRIDKEVLNSKERTGVVQQILSLANNYGKAKNLQMHYSGLPFIRTMMATQLQDEMRLFLILSFILTAVILGLFFRSVITVLASMLVVAAGVIWSMGTLAIFDYKITMLTALIPPLIVVIGIPNCVYLLNKYHSEFSLSRNKVKALLRAVDRIGIVTLFTNLTAAIGFGVFFFTKSAVLKEFGLVTSINIMAIFAISLIFIPALFSFLPAPDVRHTKYLESKVINKLLTTVTAWSFDHRRWIYLTTIIVCIISVAGIARLNSVGYIVDDLPNDDIVYKDLKYFERNFQGVMPLEIIIDTKRKNGAVSLPVMDKMDQLVQYLKTFPEIGHSLSITEGIKFARQGYYDGDSSSYAIPNVFDAAFIQPYLRTKGDKNSMFSKLISSFLDSTKQKSRISVNMADIGSKRLPVLLDSIKPKTYSLFPKDKYDVTFTGTSVVFLEGSKFIIHSLRDSLILAFIMIFGCMVALFRSWKILLISVVTNVVPLLITAGFMGWMGIRIKPSTVLVFSVALGITIDVTIRFLVNFKQELVNHDLNIAATVKRTIRDTGLSIIYTSLILIAGFSVFILSQFDGTKTLGYLTSLTLLLAMITNLTLQPALLLWVDKAEQKKIDTQWLTEEENIGDTR